LKNDDIFYIIDEIKVFKDTVGSGISLSLDGEPLSVLRDTPNYNDIVMR